MSSLTMTLRFDESQSRVTVETTAKGMLAKLAHDLSIDARKLDATTAIAGEQITVDLTVPVRELFVRGVRKGGSVDTGVLSASDRTEIERKVRSEVLNGDTVKVKLAAKSSLEVGRSQLDARGEIEVGARRAPTSCSVTLELTEALATASGRARIHLPALGITPPKGPLNAFRVDDEVVVDFKLVFTRG